MYIHVDTNYKKTHMSKQSYMNYFLGFQYTNVY